MVAGSQTVAHPTVNRGAGNDPRNQSGPGGIVLVLVPGRRGRCRETASASRRGGAGRSGNGSTGDQIIRPAFYRPAVAADEHSKFGQGPGAAAIRRAAASYYHQGRGSAANGASPGRSR